ncbi:MAG: type VII secretion protein EssC [Bacilli bacterium]|nr:type VII secretion protein EssC [Bacilli bacterium]
MKIFLFYTDKLYTFIMPKEIEGSFSFDVDKNETSKLINVEAREGKWVIYSVDGVELYHNNSLVSNTVLTDDTFYIVGKNGKKYLIYAKDISTDKYSLFKHGKTPLIIGNDERANIKYNCPYLNKNLISIKKSENTIILEQSQIGLTYVNDKINLSTQLIIKPGDTINLFGMKIIVINKLVIMNNPGGKVTITNNSKLILKTINSEVVNNNIKIIDKELYNKNDYYSKSPRIRRIIETKDINLSPPPTDNSNDQMPFIMRIVPMLAMGMTSCATLMQTVMRLNSGETTLKQSWPQLAMSIGMLISMLIWPFVMNIYNKRQKKKKREETIQKYDAYLAKKEKEIQKEVHLQRDILIENLITVNDCLDIIIKGNVGFWDKRTDQNDFLVTRFGMGRQKLDININYREEDFSIDEDELRERADNLAERYKYINNVPVSYSFYDNKITGIMGFDRKKSFNFVNNILLQLITFYSYEDLKIVVFTSEINKDNWEYVKYLPHNFSNDKKIRFFASDQDSAKSLMGYLSNLLAIINEKGSNDDKPDRPYYLIIVDEYDLVKRFDFIKEITELEEKDNKSFSLVIIEEKLGKLPSKCNNFISLANDSGTILMNSFEKQERITFKDEINSNIDMLSIARKMSNIPIEFEEEYGHIPDAISFLEMHEVGKIEQLNVLNRWNINDPTVSLRALIGFDPQEEPMYLDLHEKAHGPHGLIAGTTGSGKSEFIITYILSMCINYSPDDISFILIDYKGGGLALAFENRATGVILPHLAGTITNLDKAEMDRTLVSINSEAKRRQELFNEARETTEESTMDIYKYQRLYKEGKLKEPVSHLFIICDEFAELKAQQPEFMDNLISIARIGRSLGVHLILATQKPSGVVNDQIWSNTRFRVCLKVQDESDSKEMLKKPDAAHITQAGRYYLQVGYDEVYSLGQSGYTGAKYYPSDRIIKQVDKSINIINDFGQYIKSIQASNGPKLKAEGEQLQAVLKNIISISNQTGKKSRKLWLDNIPELIYEDEIEKKYDFKPQEYNVTAVIGEYDAPEKQEQGIVTYNYIKDGNTIIYGNDSVEREMFLNAMVYSTIKNHTPDEVNFYVVDLGSESIRTYEKTPFFGGYTTINEANRIYNLFELLDKEVSKRKNLFANYSGEYEKYIKNSGEKMPLLVVIINNYDSLKDNFDDLTFNVFPSATRDSDRYGIVYVMTATGVNSVRTAISQNFSNFYTFKLKDSYDYRFLFNKKKSITPRNITGRGILDNGELCEYQVLTISNAENLDNYTSEFVKNIQDRYKTHKTYLKLPSMPRKLRLENVLDNISDLTNVPVGISNDTVETQYVDLISNIGIIISAQKMEKTISFVKSLSTLVKNIKNINIIIIDAKKLLGLNNKEFPNYYINNLEMVLKSLKDYVDKLIKAQSEQQGVLIINGVDELVKSISETKPMEELFESLKKYEKIGTVIVEANNKLKNYNTQLWFRNIISTGNGIWIGNGVSNQSSIACTTTRKMQRKIKDDMGYIITDNNAEFSKLLDFYNNDY